jgi:LysM repeat protein
MGLISSRIRWWAIPILLVLVPSLLVGCTRSATTVEPTKADVVQPAMTDTPVPAADTTVPAEEQPEPDPQPTVEVVPTEQAGEPTRAPKATPEATPESPPPEATAAPSADEQIHTVLAGDTLFTIALLYDVAVEDIVARNNIINVHQIEAGQQLVIPSPSGAPPGPAAGEQIHTVQPGENLFRIALQYSLSFETVAAYNGIPWPYTIFVGQQIKIPVAP